MPTLRILPDAERVEAAMLDSAGTSGFVDGAGFCAFRQWVDRLDGPGFLKRRPCSRLASRIVLWSTARELKPNPFGAFVHEPAFARAALELVAELKSGLLSPEAFAEAVRELGPARQQRARALAAVYEAYEARMLKLGLADREDAVRGATERLRSEGLPAGFSRYGGFSFQAIHDWSPARLSLLGALAQVCRAKGLPVEVELPGAGSSEIDGCADRALADLERRHSELPNLEARKEDRVGLGRPLAPVAARLFGTGVTPEEATPPALRLLALPGARAETRALAQAVRGYLDEGVAPERVAVCFRDLGDEAEALAEALVEMGVSARSRRGAPLAASAVGRLALQLPLLVDDGFPAAGVARVLTHRYARAVSRPLLDAPARWFKLASVRDDRLGAEKGQGAYEVRLGALAERIEERQLPQLEAVRERTRKLFGVLAQLPEQATALELLERWWGCVGALGILEAVRAPEQREAEGTALGAAVLHALARDQAAADALRDLTAEIDAALKLSGAGVERMHRRTFHRWLVDAAQDFSLSPSGPRAGAVRILDVSELPGREFDRICLGGLTEGRLPMREVPHALFPDEDRRVVNRWAKRDVFRVVGGDDGARVPWRLAEDRLLLYLALTASKGPVVASYARTGGDGAERVPSPFINELSRVFGVPVEVLPLAPVRPLDDVETEQELRTRVALEGFAPRVLRTGDPELVPSVARAPFQSEPWFARASGLIEIERERMAFFSDPLRPPGAFSGAVTEEALLPAVRQAFAFGPDHPLDATALGHFGNCAFQGFLGFVLRLEEPEAPGEEVDSRGQGSFWHGVLEHLYPLLQRHGLLGIPADDVPAALIDESVQVAAERMRERKHLGHPALWKLGREKARAMARRMLSADHHGLPFEGMVPRHTELWFGRKSSPEGWREVVLPLAQGAPVYFQGGIDRVDAGGGRAAVLDYKAGTLQPAKLKDEFLTSQFQIPLYLHALRASGQTGELDGGWMSLRDGEPLEVRRALAGQTVDELLEVEPKARAALAEAGKLNLANTVERVVSGLRAGRFEARPHDCDWCAFRAICRISDRKLEEPGG